MSLATSTSTFATRAPTMTTSNSTTFDSHTLNMIVNGCVSSFYRSWRFMGNIAFAFLFSLLAAVGAILTISAHLRQPSHPSHDDLHSNTR